MKKYIIAGLIAVATIGIAADYNVNVSIPVNTQTVINKTATVAQVESLSVMTRGTNPVFMIRIVLKDAEGAELDRKTVRMTIEQARQLMPEIDAVMTQAQGAIAANISTLLGE
jgi:hypothetical protein